MSSEQDAIQLTSTLPIEIIRLAHQIHAFIQSGHHRPRQDIVQLVKSVVEQSPLPPTSEFDQGRQTRSTSRNSALSTPFPPNWVIDRSGYNEAIHNLLAVVPASTVQQGDFGPRSTGHNISLSNNESTTSTSTNMSSSTPNTPAFTEDQQTWIQQLVAQSIQTAVTQLAAQQTSLPPRDNRVTNEPVISSITKDDGHSTFKPEVVGYFHPDLSSTYGKDDIVYSGKETIYRDVHAFVDRLNDMVPVYGASAIRSNLVKCLRGRANAWYTTQLTPLEKEGLRNGERITLWTNALINKFRESPIIALNRLFGIKYTTSDARQRHEPADYVYEVIRRAKAAGFDQTVQQLT